MWLQTCEWRADRGRAAAVAGGVAVAGRAEGEVEVHQVWRLHHRPLLDPHVRAVRTEVRGQGTHSIDHLWHLLLIMASLIGFGIAYWFF